MPGNRSISKIDHVSDHMMSMPEHMIDHVVFFFKCPPIEVLLHLDISTVPSAFASIAIRFLNAY